MADVVIETVPLGMQWPTLDPFLFCVHHHDAYPVANEHLGPKASLVGRRLGMDFDGIDGWNMYHGQTVPGFPQHPHRGFETVTFVRQGLIDHSDSLGAVARYGRGDVQWLTAGQGIVHAEMFPLLDRNQPNPVELFQIWLNLPAANKMAVPRFAMFWDRAIPRHVPAGAGVEVTVVAGPLGDARPPDPPPDSWAAQVDTDVAIWLIRLDAGASWTVPAARTPETLRMLYLFAGGTVGVGGVPVETRTGAAIRSDVDVSLQAESTTEILLLQGRPIREPVARYGPFVMNTKAEIQQAFEDYQATGFGGWPWDVDDPTHGPDRGRFARHIDGTVDEP